MSASTTCATTGVRLGDRRWFTDEDGTGRAKVLLINRALTRRFFQDRRPVKTLVTLNGEPWEIIGVVGDGRQGNLDAEAEPQWFTISGSSRPKSR